MVTTYKHEQTSGKVSMLKGSNENMSMVIPTEHMSVGNRKRIDNMVPFTFCIAQ